MLLFKLLQIIKTYETESNSLWREIDYKICTTNLQKTHYTTIFLLGYPNDDASLLYAVLRERTRYAKIKCIREKIITSSA